MKNSTITIKLICHQVYICYVDEHFTKRGSRRVSLTYVEHGHFQNSSAIFVGVSRARGGTIYVGGPEALVRRSVAAPTRLPVHEPEITETRPAAVLGADCRRVRFREISRHVPAQHPDAFRLLVTTREIVAGHPRRFQTGGEHVVARLVAAHAFRAAGTSSVALAHVHLGLERRAHEAAQTVCPAIHKKRIHSTASRRILHLCPIGGGRRNRSVEITLHALFGRSHVEIIKFYKIDLFFVDIIVD